jgi:hypothetical protein
LLDTILHAIRPPGALGAAMLAAGGLGLALGVISALRSRAPGADAPRLAARVVAHGHTNLGAAGLGRHP